MMADSSALRFSSMMADSSALRFSSRRVRPVAGASLAGSGCHPSLALPSPVLGVTLAALTDSTVICE
jgi:hypothetical protein